jgi:hypothetical protein
MVFKVFQKLSLPYTNINFIYASLKLLTSFKNAYCNPLQSSLCDWLIFCIADLSLAAEKKCGRITLSQAASGMMLQNHSRLSVRIFSVKIAALGSLKRFTGFVELVSNLKGAS